MEYVVFSFVVSLLVVLMVVLKLKLLLQEVEQVGVAVVVELIVLGNMVY